MPTTKPWTLKVDGLVDKPANYALDDFIKPLALEQRIYRHRCVEGWSMVILSPPCALPLTNRGATAYERLSLASYIAFLFHNISVS
jgi:sulfoxide reductase catalytic subunit YedY